MDKYKRDQMKYIYRSIISLNQNLDTNLNPPGHENGNWFCNGPGPTHQSPKIELRLFLWQIVKLSVGLKVGCFSWQSPRINFAGLYVGLLPDLFFGLVSGVGVWLVGVAVSGYLCAPPSPSTLSSGLSQCPPIAQPKRFHYRQTFSNLTESDARLFGGKCGLK